jgi:hypothetical protein
MPSVQRVEHRDAEVALAPDDVVLTLLASFGMLLEPARAASAKSSTVRRSM